MTSAQAARLYPVAVAPLEQDSGTRRWAAGIVVVTLEIVLVGAGAAFGLAGAFAQALVVQLGPLPIPVGLVFSLAGPVALARWVAVGSASRWSAAAVTLGWLVAAVTMSSRGPGGSLVMVSEPAGTAALGYCFLGLGTLGLGLAVGLPPQRLRRRKV